MAITPEFYYVLTVGGQSNSMAYGEGIPLPATLDIGNDRIKQLARRTTRTPNGIASTFNEVIPLDHCPHDVESVVSTLNHPQATPAQYGTVSQVLHIAKKMLQYLPENAGILVVPCSRGGSAFTTGVDGTYDVATGATANSTRWGIGKPLYQDMLARTKVALEQNPLNKMLGVVWMQGEFDLQQASTYMNQPALFNEMFNQFKTDLVDYNEQMPNGDALKMPWIVGGTTYYWQDTYATPYSVVYGNYQNREHENMFFVPLTLDDNGNHIPTNLPAEDPDIPEIGYYGSGGRTSTNWTSSTRQTHFSTVARRGIISDRLAYSALVANGIKPLQLDAETNSTLAFTTELPTVTKATQGSALAWTVEVTGGRAPYTYAWGNDAGLMFNVTDATLPLTSSANSATLNGVGVIVWVTDADGVTISSETTIDFGGAMALSKGLKPNVIVDAGEAITLSVEAIGGTAPYTYAWKDEADTVLESTTDTLLVTDSATDDLNEKVYTCTITASGGTEITTESRILVRQALVETEPVALVDPEIPEPDEPLAFVELLDATTYATQGGTLGWSVEVVGGIAPYTYQWRNSNGMIFEAVTTPTIQLTTNANKATLNGIGIICKVTDSQGTVIETNTVINFPDAFTIGTNIASTKTAVTGTSQTLNFNVLGGVEPITFAWSNTAGVITTGITGTGRNSQLVFNATTSTTISVRATDALGTVLNGSQVLTVVPAVSYSTPLPATATVVSGVSKTFNVVVSGGIAPYTFAWSETDGDITTGVTSNGVNSSLTYTPTTNTTITVKVTDANNTVVNSAQVVTVTPALSYSTPLPTTATVVSGVSKTLSVVASGGTAPYTFAWSNTAGAITSGVTSSGANSSLTYTPTTNTTITVKVTDANNTVVNSAQVVTVTPALSYSTPLPTTATVVSGIPKTLSVVASGGTAPYTFAWSNTAGAITSGVTSSGANSSLAYTPTTNTTITVKVTDANNTVVNSAQVVTVTPALNFETQLELTKNVMEDDTVINVVKATGGTAPYTFVWTNTAGTITTGIVTNGDTSTLTFDATISDVIGIRITDANNTSIQGSQTLTVTETPPLVFVSKFVDNGTYDAGDQINLSVEVEGGDAPYTFVWRNDTGIVNETSSTDNSSTYVGEASINDSYVCTITDSDGQVLIASHAVQINVVEPEPIEPEPIEPSEPKLVRLANIVETENYFNHLRIGSIFVDSNRVLTQENMNEFVRMFVIYGLCTHRVHYEMVKLNTEINSEINSQE